MKIIYYALYKNPKYQILLYTNLAEILATGKGKFYNNKLILNKNCSFNKYEKQVFTKIKIGQESNFHLSDFYKWIDSLYNELYDKKYLKNYILFERYTKQFKLLIRESVHKTFDKKLVEYINSENISELNSIIKNIEMIHFPENIIHTNGKVVYPFNKDRQDIIEEAAQNRAGIFRRP